MTVVFNEITSDSLIHTPKTATSNILRTTSFRLKYMAVSVS